MRAVARARERLPELRAEIFGDGPDREEVLRLIEADGLDGAVTAPGFAPAEEVRERLRRALCHLFPSTPRGLRPRRRRGSVARDADDRRATAPTTRRAELVVDGENGVVAASAEPDELAEAIARVASGGHDAAGVDGRVVPAQPQAAVARELARRPRRRLRAVGAARRPQRAPPRPRRDRRRRDVRAAARAGAAGPRRRPAADAVRRRARPTRRSLPSRGRARCDRPRSRASAEPRQTGARRADAPPPRRSPSAVSNLLHNTLNTAPALAGVPQVTTIHDVIYKRFPETAGRLNFRRRAARAARGAALAPRDDRLAGLEGGHRALPRRRPVAGRRRPLTAPACAEPSDPVGDAELRARLELGEARIVLTVAAKRPHKNLGRLLDAFVRLETDAVLVVPGFETPSTPPSSRGEPATAFASLAGWTTERWTASTEPPPASCSPRSRRASACPCSRR